MTDPQPDFRPVPGTAEQLEPGLRRIVAPNPSPMTFRGTNTYLLGDREIAVIDPGPEDDTHLKAILDAVQDGARISHILVTHAHLDHSPLARPLARATGAPVLAFGDAKSGRSAIMQELAATGRIGGGEGVDAGFAPDHQIRDGDRITSDEWVIDAHHTPGHFGNHLCFSWNDVLFSGDLVMGWATSLVSPPDGDLTAFMASLKRLQNRTWRAFHAGHGAPVADPAARLSELITHRDGRGAAIIAALQDGPADAASLAARIYTDIPATLLPMAERNVLAHLVDLVQQKRVQHDGPLRADAVFRRL
ncbi:MBL fold metallo-hydrolase [Thalassococcus sp. CAU 1522]|uniref:MBL fold metallo-hydrolase n=1 Tax=Thalassococcus arenae TaxID=2851652 RepID=A0ABS6NAB7_9RHOB|nr:MBL fold metallo-hydrolase [Thalassococcus arenae]MBV2360918.1 MBL fold metallo-hydrolase [Thalassococcus arenae]